MNDRTKIRPSRGRRYQPEKTQPTHHDFYQEEKPQPAVILSQFGLNPLVKAAGTILPLGYQISTQAYDPEDGVAELRDKTAAQIKKFASEASHSGVREDVIKKSSYILCTYLDEMVMDTHWGGRDDSVWKVNPLLQEFHKDNWGGDRFFEYLRQAQDDPSRSLDLLELMYLCMSLGFAGKYKILDEGHVELGRLRRDVYEQIVRHRGEINNELSPNWRGSGEQRQKLRGLVPAWVVLSLAAVLLVGIYLWFNTEINDVALNADIQLSNVGQELRLAKNSLEFTEPSTNTTTSDAQPTDPSPPVNFYERDESKDIPPESLLGQFKSNRSELTQAHKEELDDFAARIRANADIGTINIEVWGRASRTGSLARNIVLAEERAQSVANYLRAKNIQHLRVNAQGLGVDDPLTPEIDAPYDSPEYKKAFIQVNQSVQILVNY